MHFPVTHLPPPPPFTAFFPPPQDAKPIDNVFKVCCMLHNRLLKFDGLDRLGHAEEDWIAASLNDDDRRVDAQHNAFEQRMRLCPLHNPDTVREPAHFELRETLITHYRHAWLKKEVMWRLSASHTHQSTQSADPDEEEFDDEHYDI